MAAAPRFDGLPLFDSEPIYDTDDVFNGLSEENNEEAMVAVDAGDDLVSQHEAKALTSLGYNEKASAATLLAYSRRPRPPRPRLPRAGRQAGLSVASRGLHLRGRLRLRTRPPPRARCWDPGPPRGVVPHLRRLGETSPSPTEEQRGDAARKCCHEQVLVRARADGCTTTTLPMAFFTNFGAPTKCSTMGLDINTDSGEVTVTPLLVVDISKDVPKPMVESEFISSKFLANMKLGPASPTKCLMNYFGWDTDSVLHSAMNIQTQVYANATGAALTFYLDKLPGDPIVLWEQPVKQFVDCQPWPPPILLEILCDNAMIRPMPWPNFIISAVIGGGFMRWLWDPGICFFQCCLVVGVTIRISVAVLHFVEKYYMDQVHIPTDIEACRAVSHVICSGYFLNFLLESGRNMYQIYLLAVEIKQPSTTKTLSEDVTWSSSNLDSVGKLFLDICQAARVSSVAVQTLMFQGLIQGKEVSILLDSGFGGENLFTSLEGVSTILNPVIVLVANGEQVDCKWQWLQALWQVQDCFVTPNLTDSPAVLYVVGSSVPQCTLQQLLIIQKDDHPVTEEVVTKDIQIILGAFVELHMSCFLKRSVNGQILDCDVSGLQVCRKERELVTRWIHQLWVRAQDHMKKQADKHRTKYEVIIVSNNIVQYILEMQSGSHRRFRPRESEQYLD